MSRVSEVEAEIISADGQYCEGAWIGPESLRHLARALAAEVDVLTTELTRVKAESLRVVAMTEDRSPINMDTVVRHIHIDGQVFRLERWEATE